MGVGLGLIGVLVGLLAAQGAQKLFGWHLAGSWSGIAVLAGSSSAATVLLAVAGRHPPRPHLPLLSRPLSHLPRSRPAMPATGALEI